MRKRYYQVPHLSQDTPWESNKNTINILARAKRSALSHLSNKICILVNNANHDIIPWCVRLYVKIVNEL